LWPVVAVLGTIALATSAAPVPAPLPPSSVADSLAAPPPVAALLQRACYDCHSEQSRWPWYARVAPVSWLLARDVREGRKQVNFSRWNTYSPTTRRHKLQWMGRVIRNGSMPPLLYRVVHRDARLSANERAMLERWIAVEIAKTS